MLNRRALIIVNSVYHLITAVNLRLNVLENIECDILVTDITFVLKEYVNRLKEIGLFNLVVFGKIKDLNKKYSIANDNEILDLFSNMDSIFRWSLDKELAEYTEVYFSNFDIFSRILASKFYYSSCEFIWYEDGFSSYVIDYLKEERALINRNSEGKKIKDKVKKVLLYEPRLAIRGDNILNSPLPKINKSDIKLKKILNYIFDYKGPEQFADFIFLEQSFRAEGIKSNDIDLMRECMNQVGSNRFVVKPHPRNPENLPFYLGITRKYTSYAPWELFLLNEDMKNKTIITVCSNAALTGSLVFGMDVNTVMLYKLFKGRVLWKEDHILKKYLNNFKRRFSGDNYYIPKTIYELRNILRYLGGSNGQQD